jgi:hypothetical protein
MIRYSPSGERGLDRRLTPQSEKPRPGRRAGAQWDKHALRGGLLRTRRGPGRTRAPRLI